MPEYACPRRSRFGQEFSPTLRFGPPHRTWTWRHLDLAALPMTACCDHAVANGYLFHNHSQIGAPKYTLPNKNAANTGTVNGTV